VRSLAELSLHFEERTDGFALVEIRQESLGRILAWLAHASQRYPDARFLALLDNSLLPGDEVGQDVVDALYEAGAHGKASSPRNLQHIMALGELYGADLAARNAAISSNRSPVEWAWSVLPWQAS
jgi:hypothetical protein